MTFDEARRAVMAQPFRLPKAATAIEAEVGARMAAAVSGEKHRRGSRRPPQDGYFPSQRTGPHVLDREKRQAVCAALWDAGMTRKQIAAQTGWCSDTVRSYLQHEGRAPMGAMSAPGAGAAE